jgi:hypothetical protein
VNKQPSLRVLKAAFRSAKASDWIQRVESVCKFELLVYNEAISLPFTQENFVLMCSAYKLFLREVPNCLLKLIDPSQNICINNAQSGMSFLRH